MAGGLSLVLLAKDRADGREFEPVWPHRSGLAVSGDAKSLSVTDVNGDGVPELSFGINDAEMTSYVRRAATPRPDTETVSIRLVGGAGNPREVGAKVMVNGTQTFEVRAGEGYLSQSAAAIRCSVPKSEGLRLIEVTWADGTKTSFENPQAQGGSLELRKP